MKGDTLARIRSRESWVSIREIPPVEHTLSAESTVVKCGDETVDTSLNNGGGADDDNVLEASSSNGTNPGKKKYIRRPTPRYQRVDHRQDEGDDDNDDYDSKLGIDRLPTHSDEGDMGFEVQMSSRESGSSNGDSDFPLDEHPGSASSSYHGFTKPGQKNILSHFSTPPSKGKSLFVDIDNEQAHGNGIMHDTPRATNRSESTRAAKLLHSPMYKITLKHKKKEAVVDTLATVVLEVEHLADPYDSPNPMAHPVNSTDTDDSSAQVDARWESYHAKYAVDDEKLKPSNKVGSSRDDQQQWRDTLLDVNSAPSCASVDSRNSETFEDLLIQDCIETGLPSPDKRRERRAKDSDENKAEFFPDAEQDTASGIIPTRSVSQPCEDITTQEASNKETSKINDHGLNPAEALSVLSILTGEEDFGNGNASMVPPIHSFCTEMDSMKELETIPGLHPTIPSQSEDVTIHDDLVPAKESLHVESEQIKADVNQDIDTAQRQQSKKLLVLPKKALMQDFDEDIQTPKIEIALVPSSSVSEDTISDVSESSCAKIQHGGQPPHEGNSIHTIQLTTHRLPLHEQDEKSDGSDGRLRWWRKNGKRLVEEKVSTLQTPKVTLRSFQSETTKAWGGVQQPRDNDVSSSESQIGDQSSSNSNNSSNKKEQYVSAFKRGISMFEKRQTKAMPQREVKKFGWSKEARLIGTISRQQGHKSIHAPQPKPDADGSNSMTHGGRNKKLDDSIDDSHTTTQWVDEVVREGSRFWRPGHEDSSGDGAIGLGPSPKVRKNLEHDDAPVMEVLNPYDHTIMSPSPRPLQLDDTKDVVITTNNHFFANHDIVPADSLDEADYTADILDVASTLTEETPTPPPSDINTPKETVQPALSCDPNIEERNQKTVTVVLGCNKEPILDASSTVYIPSWRLDPSENLSDFILQTEYKRSNSTVVYHVHKHIIGVGPRRSELLEDIFRSSDASSAQIILEDEASTYLPDILDYLYNSKSELELTTDNVLGYRYLARMFKIYPVIRESSEFVLQDMKIENMSTYISDSFRYSDEMVTNVIAAKCGEEIENIEITDILWTAMDPSLFLRVISCPKIDRKKVSSRLSLLLKEYFVLHKYEMDVKIFQQVSNIALLPLIHREAALPLLEICEEFGAPVALHPLQKRCAQVIACYWKTTSEADRRRLFAMLRSLPSHFTVDFLELVESGNTMAWLDAPLTKALRDSKRNAKNNDGYENTDSFSVVKLCGDDFSTHEIHEPLSWRMDPVSSFSDWTFKVKHRNEDKVDIYHVHKHILSVGPYKSTFFADIFLSDDQTNTRTGSTIIELAEGPTELVPVVFDFLYSPDHNLVITSRTACALSFLSRVFGIWMLNKKVIEYVQRDIDLTTMLRYIEDAELYDDERIMNLAIRKCAVGIKGIEPESDLLHGMKPDFFGRIIASSDIDRNSSCHVNILIAKYFTMHELDEGLLGELMKQVPLKDCDRDSALKLLDVMSSVKAQGIAIFAEIRKRCANVLMENWKDIRESKREEAFNILRTLDTGLVVDIFDAVEGEYYKRHHDNMSVQSKLVKRYRAQLAEAKEQREEQIAKVQLEHEAMVSDLLRKHDELEAELASYRDATSRRALRSCGGFPHAIIPSPRRQPVDASRQSFIPRLNSKAGGLASPKSTTETPKDNNSEGGQAPKTAGSSCSPQHLSSTAMTSLDQSPSLFGRVFGCGPQAPAEGTKSTQNGIATALLAVQREQQSLIGGHDGIANCKK